MSNSTHGVERPVHGALDYGELERLGLHPREVLDFSVSAWGCDGLFWTMSLPRGTSYSAPLRVGTVRLS